MYLPVSIFSYPDCRKEMERLHNNVYDMDDDYLVDECEGETVGKNVRVNMIIRRYNSYGMPLTNKDRESLINYYILTHSSEVMEIDSPQDDHEAKRRKAKGKK